MRGQISKRFGVIVLAGLLGAICFRSPAAEPVRTATDPVRIGMVNTLFRDTPQSMVMAMMRPFGAIMESQTGVRGELVAGGDAETLGAQLAAGTVQLAIFHGIEFGWAKKKHPELKPLVIAVNQNRFLSAHVVVRSDSKVVNLAELHDKSIAVPCHTREHCHLFLRRRCRDCKPQVFFAKVTTPPNTEEALDDAVDGVVQATVVDGVSLDCYKRLKPGRASKLRIVQTSEVFPAAVIAYRPGTLDDATLKRFREGLINANRTILGRQMLTLWKLTAFEEVPADYDHALSEIVKAYPVPMKE